MEKVKQNEETKSFMKAEGLYEKTGKQDFHSDMEEVFETLTENPIKTEQQRFLESNCMRYMILHELQHKQ